MQKGSNDHGCFGSIKAKLNAKKHKNNEDKKRFHSSSSSSPDRKKVPKENMNPDSS